MKKPSRAGRKEPRDETLRQVGWAAVLLLVVFLMYAPQRARAQSPALVLAHANVIDGSGAAVREDVTVVLRDGRIAAILEGAYEPEDGAGDAPHVIDLENRYLLPGLWNNHSHLSDLLPDPKETLVDEPLLRAAIRGGRNAMDALRRGFTSLRMTGERDYIDVAWRDAFADRVFVGPRIIAAGNPIAGRAGVLEVGVDGAAETRRMVQRHVDNGVDIIKIIADRLEPEEIEAAITTAHELGVKIIAHASDPTARFAVELGVDGIEHGYRLADETLRLMAENNTFYDPTIVCNLSAEYIADRERLISAAGFEANADVAEGRVMVAYADERSPETAQRQRDILNKAMAAGVKIIPGGDSTPIGEIGLLEIEQLVFSGLSPMQAIIAATRNSAEMVGLLDEVGTVEIGKTADLIVVDDNPLDHISNLRTLRMVLKDGVPVNLDREAGAASFWKLYFLEDGS